MVIDYRREFSIMKLCLKIILIFFVTGLQAQPSKSNNVPLAKADLIEKMKITDFPPVFPTGSIIIKYEILYHAGGKTLICTGASDTLSEQCKSAMKTADTGSNLYLDVLYRIGSASFTNSRRYKIK